MNRLYFTLLLIIGLLGAVTSSCIEDGFSTSPSDQPVFSVDTLDMGTIFTDQLSTTHRFLVYNRSDKSMSISRVAVSGDNASMFRLNVDGFGGTEFNDVEIRANDSIFVLVSTVLPPNNQTVPVRLTASLDFLTNGVTKSVVLAATGRDVVRLSAEVYDKDVELTSERPYQIYDSLVVMPGATLTIAPGAELYFHDGAYMAVRGTLKAVGTVNNEITFAGDRTGFVAGDISFDIMSRQWVGLFFTSTSRENELDYCHVCNTWQGVTVDGSESDDPVKVTMINSRLRNSGGYALEVYHADVEAYGCEIAEAANGAVLLHGGKAVFNHCTLANYYLFSALGGPILQFEHMDDKSSDDSGLPYLSADISNTIIYGNGRDISHGNLTGTNVYMRNCLLKSEGSDDDNFIGVIWNADPLFYTIREDYFFDYRLRESSPAIGSADPNLTASQSSVDRYGLFRGDAPDIGAYVYVPSQD